MRSAEQPPRRGNRRRAVLVAVLLGLAALGGMLQLLPGDDMSRAGQQSAPLRRAALPRPADRAIIGAGHAQAAAQQSQRARAAVDPGRVAPRLSAHNGQRPVRTGGRRIRVRSPYDPPAPSPWLPPEVYDDDTAIAGRVLGEDGEPIADALVTLEGRRYFDPEAAGARGERQGTTSDVLGLYAFVALEPGLYRLRAEAPRDYEAAQRTVRSGVHSADLVLRLARDAWAYGTVTGVRGEPLEGVLVLQSGRPEQQTVTDAAGAYTLPLVVGERTRTVALRFEREDYRAAGLRVDRREWVGQGSVPLDVELEPLHALATVRGTLVDTAGEPVAGERVRLVSAELARSFEATSDAEGRFALRGVPAGSDYLLLVRPDGPWQDYARRGLRVSADGADLQITLRPLALGSVTGRVVDPAGSPIPGFDLTVRSTSAAAFLQPVHADAAGRFRADEVPAGDLIFESRAYPSLSVRGVHLPAGSERAVELVLDWGTHRLAGRVVGARGRAVPAARVWLTAEHRAGGLLSRSSRMTTADADGVFTFTGLGPGIHQLRIDAPGFETASIEHRVAAPVEQVRIRLD